MRSLLLRWGVAVIVGTLWGAIVSPDPRWNPGSEGDVDGVQRDALRAVNENSYLARAGRRQSDGPLMFF